MKNKDTLILVWWNTSLSRLTGAPLLDDLDREGVWELVNKLMYKLSMDFIALTEVSKADIPDIEKNCIKGGYALFAGVKEVGRTTFDFCVIYKKSAFSLFEHEYLTAEVNGQTIKAGLRVGLEVKSTGDSLYIILSHWASRAHSSGEGKRKHSAQALSEEINRLKISSREVGVEHPYIILMGDYNDEPFESNIASTLKGSRDKVLVEKRGELFYNPFWGEMTVKNGKIFSGSYYYSGANSDLMQFGMWRMFDQMMYSHAFFIKDSIWKHVNLKNTILAPNSILQRVTASNSKLDHLPIVGIIKKREV